MEPFTDDSAYFMKNCEHVFHRECLTSYLKAEISNNRCPIKCCLPTCKAVIASEDMVRNLSQEDLDKYHKQSLDLAVNHNNADMSWCPTANCQYVFVFNAKENSDFTCPVC